MGSELFFPEIGDHKRAQAARQVCAGCKVRENCLADALATGTQHGVWGGLSVRERRRLRARSSTPTAA
ncbi:MAG: WhiB family transcriptional regulator [Acidimicrobiaceae bacterium]|nr:WhiB family transcriptional regulator [Acidimicrobiaceae bacterium]MYI36994.1 WhiB family transcriptional regulator [Acidimicrobiaceae bacterium]